MVALKSGILDQQISRRIFEVHSEETSSDSSTSSLDLSDNDEMDILEELAMRPVDHNAVLQGTSNSALSIRTISLDLCHDDETEILEELTLSWGR